MPFNGTGMFVRLRNWVADAAAGVKIRADYHDIEDDGFADGLTQCITKDGQTTIMQNIPMNSKRIIALQDPADPQDAATKAYADLKLPLAGGTITGNLAVTGSVGALGYKTRPGVSGAFGANLFNFNWTGNLEAWVDTTKVGTLATTAYVETRAEAWAAQYAAPKVNRAGDTMTGALTLPYTFATSNVYYFGATGAGYLQWQGGGTYYLGGGGTAWHTGNLNPILDGRLALSADLDVTADGGIHEVPGSAITAIVCSPSNGHPITGARYRQLQLQTPAGWYAVGY